MNHWLFKTEPADYSWDDLVRAGRGSWDGVRNALARQHLGRVARGDQVLVYHTGAVKSVIGIARVTRGAYVDPAAGDERAVQVDLAPVRPLPRAVSIGEIRLRKELAELPLLRNSRLSVMPVTPEEWGLLLGLAGEKG